jgi:hypothetical protein
MRHTTLGTLAVLTMSYGIAHAAVVGTGSCAFQPANASQQTCTFVEAPDGNGEPNIVVFSLFAADLPLGNIYLHEPGGAANDASDILMFTSSTGGALANTFTLVSDPDNETLGLVIPQGTPANAIMEEAPDGQFTTFTVSTSPNANNGTIFTDTFMINSDPTPEPGTILLLGSALLALGAIRLVPRTIA